MKPIVMLTDTAEREQLVAAFDACGIGTERRKVENPLLSLHALEVKHDSEPEVIRCAVNFAKNHGKNLQARRDDAAGKSHPIDLTEQNYIKVFSETQGDFIFLYFRDRDGKT